MSAESAGGDTVVGRVVKPHGLGGEVVVDASSDVPGRFDPGVVLAVDGHPMTVRASRPHAGRVLVAFEDLDDRTAAEGLRGATLSAPAADVSGQDTYYVHELVGMVVATVDGTYLGTVTDVVELPAVAGYDLLEVDLDGHAWLLPSDDDLVEVGFDDDTGDDVLVVVAPPAGLLPTDSSSNGGGLPAASPRPPPPSQRP